MRHLCQDASIIGTSFYVMDFLEGRIFRRDTSGIDVHRASRDIRRAEFDAREATQVDYAAHGLSDFGRASGLPNAKWHVGLNNIAVRRVKHSGDGTTHR
jgi:aminoglycoside phosphotransferase (APT) family kinase protein